MFSLPVQVVPFLLSFTPQWCVLTFSRTYFLPEGSVTRIVGMIGPRPSKTLLLGQWASNPRGHETHIPPPVVGSPPGLALLKGTVGKSVWDLRKEESKNCGAADHKQVPGLSNNVPFDLSHCLLGLVNGYLLTVRVSFKEHLNCFCTWIWTGLPTPGRKLHWSSKGFSFCTITSKRNGKHV